MARKYNTMKSMSRDLYSVPGFLKNTVLVHGRYVATDNTIQRSEISNLKMVMSEKKGDRPHKIIDGQQIKEWVGIGWIETGQATEDDFDFIPVVID